MDWCKTPLYVSDNIREAGGGKSASAPALHLCVRSHTAFACSIWGIRAAWEFGANVPVSDPDRLKCEVYTAVLKAGICQSGARGRCLHRASLDYLASIHGNAPNHRGLQNAVFLHIPKLFQNHSNVLSNPFFPPTQGLSG